MKLYPAIDIKGGKCVRLVHGDRDCEKVYGDPLEFALKWQSMGALCLHVVDLDAAFTGEFKNRDVIKEIVSNIKIPIQLGGGVRSKEAIRVRIEEVGASRVIIGTMAIEDPDTLKWAKSEYGAARIAVGIDAIDGKAATRGWLEKTEIDAVELAIKMRDMGIDTVIYTDISRDGTLSGPNTENTEQMVKKTWMNVIASGGMSRIEDILAVRGTGCCGVILGTALYEGSIDFAEAVKLCK